MKGVMKHIRCSNDFKKQFVSLNFVVSKLLIKRINFFCSFLKTYKKTPTKIFIVSFERHSIQKPNIEVYYKIFMSVLIREIFSPKSINCPPSWNHFNLPNYALVTSQQASAIQNYS